MEGNLTKTHIFANVMNARKLEKNGLFFEQSSDFEILRKNISPLFEIQEQLMMITFSLKQPNLNFPRNLPFCQSEEKFQFLLTKEID